MDTMARGWTAAGAWVTAAWVLAAACGGDDAPPSTDGGVDADGAIADGGPEDGADAPADADGGDAATTHAGTCADPFVLAGTLGSVALEGDTSGAVAGALDLGSCGTPGDFTGDAPPQVVVAYTVPGSGPVGLELDTNVTGTDEAFDTVVQVRTDCATTPPRGFPETCFDDADWGEPQSYGTAMATGGETLYLVITGYAEPAAGLVSEGAFRLEVYAEPNGAPTLSSATAHAYPERLELVAEAGDANGNAEGLSVQFLDAAGAVLDYDESGVVDEEDVFWTSFDDDQTGETSFEALATNSFDAVDLQALGVVQLSVVATDVYSAGSAPLQIPVSYVTEASTGEVCDATHLCIAGLVCTAGHCTTDADAAAACAGATAITVATPTTSTTTTLVTGAIAAGAGDWRAGCEPATRGAETIYSVAVPAGAYDLIARTDVDDTADDADTVLYVRASCADPATELVDGCNDDVSFLDGDFRSRVDVLEPGAGTYAIFVESLGTPLTAPLAFGLAVSLRPVLAGGAACDPEGVENRCTDGTACLGSPGSETCQ